jgi:hypothetical protein
LLAISWLIGLGRSGLRRGRGHIPASFPLPAALTAITLVCALGQPWPYRLQVFEHRARLRL